MRCAHDRATVRATFRCRAGPDKHFQPPTLINVTVPSWLWLSAVGASAYEKRTRRVTIVLGFHREMVASAEGIATSWTFEVTRRLTWTA